MYCVDLCAAVASASTVRDSFNAAEARPHIAKVESARHGSGVFVRINNQLFVATSAHFIGASTSCRVTAFKADRQPEQPFIINDPAAVWTDVGADVALLIVPQDVANDPRFIPRGIPLVLVDLDSVAGRTVWVCGVDTSTQRLITQSGSVNAAGTPWFELNVQGRHGLSGAAVLRQLEQRCVVIGLVKSPSVHPYQGSLDSQFSATTIGAATAEQVGHAFVHKLCASAGVFTDCVDVNIVLQLYHQHAAAAVPHSP